MKPCMVLVLTALILSLSGCGQKGPLYLPKPNATAFLSLVSPV